MIWLTRPPYLRWAGILLLLLVSVALDLAGRATERVPFAAVDVAAGAEVTESMVEWRDSPVGLIDGARELQGLAIVPIAAGDPITASSLGEGGVIPADWWSVPVDLPLTAARGQTVRLVVVEPEFSTDGIVAAAASSGPFGAQEPGLVAVPPALADSVARAVEAGSLVVLVGN